MNTYRAYSGANTDITCWVRDVEGNRDLSAETLTVPVYAYGKNYPLLTLDAVQATEGESPVAGKIEFTVTEDQTRRYFPAGLYRFAVKADEAVVYGGLLEVV